MEQRTSPDFIQTIQPGYKNFLRLGITSFMLFLAACGPSVVPSHIDSLSAQSPGVTGDILSDYEASCQNRIDDQDLIDLRNREAHIVLANENGNLAATLQRMAQYCEGIIPPTQ